MFYQQDPPYQRGILLLDSVFRAYTYEWSDRGQMLAEVTQGVPVRTFTYNAAGQLVRATVFTLTTEFVYNGLGARVAVSVAGHGVTSYTLDLAQGSRVLAESGVTSTVAYLYGRECLGEERDGEWLHYLSDADGYVRQGADDSGVISSTWLFDPDGTVLEGPSGPVSHLICGGVYDWSTGLIYKGGRYFDPNLGIWLALMPLVVVQGWHGRCTMFLWRGSQPQRSCDSGCWPEVCRWCFSAVMRGLWLSGVPSKKTSSRSCALGNAKRCPRLGGSRRLFTGRTPATTNTNRHRMPNQAGMCCVHTGFSR